MSVFCNFIAKLCDINSVYLFKYCSTYFTLFRVRFTQITLKFLQIPVSLANYCNNHWKIKKTYAYLTVKTFVTVLAL